MSVESCMEMRQVGCVVYDQANGSDKVILSDVNGKATRGRLLAIMGGSGAGKTTLLDILACRSSRGTSCKVEGDILINGSKRNDRAFSQESCYVTQKDLLFPSATVYECVIFSAMLRLPLDMSREDKKRRVDSVLSELDLTSCQNTLVGDDVVGIKGVSGGQKRRTSLAVELVKDPQIIFADEPTSGLDSEVALSIMNAMKTLASKNRIVICTIHQPNSDITELFDDFMLLAHGRMVFSGQWLDAVPWFSECGFDCPVRKNPTDYFLTVVKDSLVSIKMADSFKQKRVQSAGHEEGGLSYKAIDLEAPHPLSPRIKSPPLSLDCQPSIAAEREQPWRRLFVQVKVLSDRVRLNWWRNPSMLVSELIQYIFMAIFIGLMYMGSFTLDSNGVYSRLACIWFALCVLSFTPSYTTVYSYAVERPLISKELEQRQYSILSFFLSRSIVMLPVQAFECLIFVAVMYFFVGFRGGASFFFQFYITLLIFQLISESIGLLCAITTRAPTFAVITLTFVLLVLLSFSGFLTTSIPPYFIWVNRISYLTYAYNSINFMQLTGLEVTNDQGERVDAMTLLPSVMLNGLTWQANLGILGAEWFIIELMKLGALYLANWIGFL